MKLSDDELPVADEPPRHSRKDKKKKKDVDILNMNVENINEELKKLGQPIDDD